jgi:type IV secretion system protein VirB10
MKLFGRDREEDTAADLSPEGGAGPVDDADIRQEPLAGDRGIPSINRAKSIQSRVSSVLAITLMSTLGLGLLTWYYAKTLTRPAQAHQAAQAAAKSRAQGEMTLPPLGPIESPFARKDTVTAPPQVEDPSTLERVLGPSPPLPTSVTTAGTPMPVAVTGTPDGAAVKSPGELAFERRLAGPAFARASQEGGSTAQGMSPNGDPAAFGSSRTRSEGEAADSGQTLNTLLRPTVMPAVAASILPTRRFLLSKGAFIDCTLETAIDSTLPGMTTCITATDTFSADGTVVLLERGTKLVGETRGQVQQGTSRIFVLWTEARTPTGVVVPLSSPGTDELGRSGLPGEVNRHFWDRFGAAILLTVINGAVQGVVQSQSSGSSVIVSPTSTSDVMTEVLRSTVSIPPTVTKSQGDRIQVFVARDVDFRPVYDLRVANAPPQGTRP